MICWGSEAHRICCFGFAVTKDKAGFKDIADDCFERLIRDFVVVFEFGKSRVDIVQCSTVTCKTDISKRSTGVGKFESEITSTPYYSGRVVIVRCTQFCNLKELLCSLQKILGSYMAFKSFRAHKWLGVDNDLGIGCILERMLDH